jgi:hypothetical protein
LNGKSRLLAPPAKITPKIEAFFIGNRSYKKTGRKTQCLWQKPYSFDGGFPCILTEYENNAPPSRSPNCASHGCFNDSESRHILRFI